MTKYRKQAIAWGLAVMMLLTLIPGAAAAPPEKTEEVPVQDVSEVLRPPAAEPQAAESGCSAAQLAVWWSNTLEPNPDGVEDLYIYYEFPKGQKKMRDNVGLHTVKADGAWRASYCIEPGIQDSASYNTEKMKLDQWMASPYAPKTLTEQQMNAISTILLYGQVAMPQDGQYDALANMLATQLLIWEVAVGWRDAAPPYQRTNDAFIRRFEDGPQGILVSSYFLNIPQGTRKTGVVAAYDKIAANLERHDLIPSFMVRNQEKAPEIQLQPDGKGNYTATLTDQNKILDAYTFRNTDKLTFTRKGNQLTVTAKGMIPDTVVTGTRQLPSLKDQAYYVWFNGSYQQMAACAAPPVKAPVPAYFKVTVPRGGVKIVKTTSTGRDLGGWEIGLYQDETCLKPIPGSPFTTGADGTVTVPNLIPGVYYAKEIVNMVAHPHWKFDTTVQKVTVESGKTAEIGFYNAQYGKLRIIKKMETVGPKEGWVFRITDESGAEIQGSPFTTGKMGRIQTETLKPGYYTVEELLPPDSPYVCLSANPQRILVRPGKITAVTFTNALRTSRISVEKVDVHDQPLAGAKFLLEWSKDGKTWEPVFYAAAPSYGSCTNDQVKDGCLVSGEDGLVSWPGLSPELRYRITEVEAPAGFNLLTGVAYEGTLPTENAAIRVRVVNTPIFELPKSGTQSVTGLSLALALSLSAGGGLGLRIRKKED